MSRRVYQISDLNDTNADIVFGDTYSLKITSKRLKSGKCQVKFFARVREKKELYGYVLVDATRTLKDVVCGIKDRLVKIDRTCDFHHLHLYSIGKTSKDDLNFIIFDS